MDEFIQSPPELSNQYTSDKILQSYLRRMLPTEMFDKIQGDLISLGARVVDDIFLMGLDAERNLPELIQYDAWGHRIDEIKVSNGWQELKRAAVEEGLITIGYKREFNEFSRIYQFAKLYLYTPSSAIYTCPLAMTDGAARIIECLDSSNKLTDVLTHLTTADPEEFWVSGQWMTEKTGGSDLGRTETIAKEIDGKYYLTGPKWFTSAITADVAMTLARIEQDDGSSIPGSRGLSLFYLKIKDAEGKYNHIQIDRLKDKLGTKALPTGELHLQGTPAKLIGEKGRGIKQIAIMLNITRIYNSITSVSFMQRALTLAKDYAKKREAFGKTLQETPLHLKTILECEIEFRGAFALTFFVIELLGKSECNVATQEELKLLRLLTPVTKLYTAKQSIGVISELLESIGGVAYLEDSTMPRLLRDAQVLAIWEGTTNILSLDVLRSIEKEHTFGFFIKFIKDKLDILTREAFHPYVNQIKLELNNLNDFMLQSQVGHDNTLLEMEARNIAFSIARICMSALLLEHAEWEITENDSNIALYSISKWFNRKLSIVRKYEPDIDQITSLLFGN